MRYFLMDQHCAGEQGKTMALSVLAQRYLLSLSGSRQASPRTVATYSGVLQRAELFAAKQNLADFDRWQTSHVRGFVAALHKEKLAPRSIALHLSALRACFRFLLQHKLVADNPAQGVRAPKAGSRLPKALDVDQSQALMEGLNSADDALTVRDRALLELFYSSALRLSELSLLDVADLPGNTDLLRVTGKGNKTREVPVGRKARVALQAWLTHRAHMAGDGEVALFVSQRGSRLSNRQIQQRLALWGQRLGISTRVHPHKLRHSCATHFLEGANDLRAVQELLGHANLSTTQIYTHLDFQHLAKIYDNAHPRAKKKS